ncbi:MAG: glucose-1-phosphate thymidylyltransferase-like protein, partial [Bacteroidetes bacterium]|nr:glucose-1-phosphate thymidylyltransferase-like protein [Bacteroidota bacterium]
ASVDVEAVMVGYAWDLVYANESEIERDFAVLTKKGATRKADIHKTAVLIAKKRIHIGKKSIISAGAVLDASDGPIYIGNGARIFPTAFIEGPCFIGDGSLIKAGARIYGSTSIGSGSKVGGEVANSILHSHANKQHDGFLGHSYIAPWVNLGAGTTTSNLKNTYSNVKVRINGREVDSGKMFVGLTAGDHVKIGINGTIDTGTVIGPSANLYGAALPPKYIPAFTWGTVGNFSPYDLEKAITVATTAMSRRKVLASDAYKQVFRHVFSLTSNERIGTRA